MAKLQVVGWLFGYVVCCLMVYGEPQKLFAKLKNVLSLYSPSSILRIPHRPKIPRFVLLHMCYMHFGFLTPKNITLGLLRLVR